MAGCDPGGCGARSSTNPARGPGALCAHVPPSPAPRSLAAAPALRACPALHPCPRPRPPRPRGPAETQQLPDRACARPAGRRAALGLGKRAESPAFRCRLPALDPSCAGQVRGGLRQCLEAGPRRSNAGTSRRRGFRRPSPHSLHHRGLLFLIQKRREGGQRPPLPASAKKMAFPSS